MCHCRHAFPRSSELPGACPRWQRNEELRGEHCHLVVERLLLADGGLAVWRECWVINEESTLAVT
jgi:hypothetical protein